MRERGSEGPGGESRRVESACLGLEPSDPRMDPAPSMAADLTLPWALPRADGPSCFDSVFCNEPLTSTLRGPGVGQEAEHPQPQWGLVAPGSRSHWENPWRVKTVQGFM